MTLGWCSNVQRAVPGSTAIAAFALLTLTAHPATALTADAERGHTLFQQRCLACHTVGQGDRVGPDLAGVGARRDRAWLTRWISAPDRMLAEHDPLATELLQKYRSVPMPNLGLAPDEVAAVIAYLATAPSASATATSTGSTTRTSAGPATATTAPKELPAGDPARGKELFTGTRTLENGGPPCMACHSIAGIGALGGGALGPDLTAAASKYGPSGLASVLASIPFPTMAPIFGRRPLRPDEQANLRAFIQSAAVTERASGTITELAVFATLGAVVLFGAAHYRWRTRLGGVRARLVDTARSRVTASVGAPARRP